MGSPKPQLITLVTNFGTPQGKIIVGIDNSPAMLLALEERLAKESNEVRNRVRPVRADLRGFSLDEKFQFISAPFMTFNYLLTIEDQLGFLESVVRHLAPDGIVVIEAMTAATVPELTRNDGLLRQVLYRNNKRDERVLEALRRVRFNSASQLVEQDRHYRFFSEERLVEERCVTWRNHMATLREIDLLFRLVGLEILDVYGSYNLQALRHESEYMIIKGARKN